MLLCENQQIPLQTTKPASCFYRRPKGSINCRATWKQQVNAIRLEGSEQDLFILFGLSGKHLACSHPGFLQKKGLLQLLKLSESFVHLGLRPSWAQDKRSPPRMCKHHDIPPPVRRHTQKQNLEWKRKGKKKVRFGKGVTNNFAGQSDDNASVVKLKRAMEGNLR